MTSGDALIQNIAPGARIVFHHHVRLAACYGHERELNMTSMSRNPCSLNAVGHALHYFGIGPGRCTTTAKLSLRC